MNKLKLICVIALILIIIFNSSINGLAGSNDHKYPIEELQQKAIKNSLELQVLDQAIKTAESKKWTSLAPSVGIGNNFVGRGDLRFNVGWNLMETFGGGKIREINLDIAQLRLRKYELENKLKIEVLELVLALEKAERAIKRVEDKLNMLHKRLDLIKVEYKRGERDLDSLSKYWETEELLENEKANFQDEVILQTAKLEQLVGDLANT